MSALPAPVRKLRDAISYLPGVKDVELGIHNLDGFDPKHLSLPGEFGDLPAAVIRRTNGGRPGERLVTATFAVRQRSERDSAFAPGWVTVEFLAWWVRDLARSGHDVQMRPLALPPVGFGVQLGRTLKFVIEFFFTLPGTDNGPILKQLEEHADFLNQCRKQYAKALKQPTSDDWETVEEFEAAAKNDDIAAMMTLAKIYSAEGSEDHDPAAAFKWYEKAAKLGHPEARFQLGLALQNGTGTKANPKKAFAAFQEAADGGHALAMMCVGDCYQHGKGVAKDEAEALTWYRKGGEAGQPACWAQLGDCHEFGHGTPINLPEALSLYQRAIEEGFNDADVKKAIRRVEKQLGKK